MSAAPSTVPAPASTASPALLVASVAVARPAALPGRLSAPAVGDAPVSREAIEAHLPLVHQTVRRFLRKLPANVGRDDLTAAGVFGLMDALRKDGGGGSGPAFEWYARVRIRGAIVDALRQQDWLPRRARWAAAADGPAAVVSFEDMAAGDQAAALADERSLDPAEQAEQNDARARLQCAVAALPDRERLIVSMHYFEGVLFKDIGALLGVSEPRVSQLHARAMDSLRAALLDDVADPGGRAPKA